MDYRRAWEIAVEKTHGMGRLYLGEMEPENVCQAFDHCKALEEFAKMTTPPPLSIEYRLNQIDAKLDKLLTNRAC